MLDHRPWNRKSRTDDLATKSITTNHKEDMQKHLTVLCDRAREERACPLGKSDLKAICVVNPWVTVNLQRVVILREGIAAGTCQVHVCIIPPVGVQTVAGVASYKGCGSHVGVYCPYPHWGATRVLEGEQVS